MRFQAARSAGNNIKKTEALLVSLPATADKIHL